ncbi:MAG: AAA family ATPase [Muribaculaceae bacterium]|nr:AAA family ATPase [Muribaculaceae bacterium]
MVRQPADIARKITDETGINLFLTGKAGTGKTTFLHRLVSESGKKIVVLAPTGVAAINAGGNTIHSFFQLDFAPFIPGVSTAQTAAGNRFSKNKIAIIRTMDLLVIDEVSMVRPDVLDSVDAVLRRFRNPVRPFGGVQLLLIGDLRQLAPVAQEQEWSLLSRHYASPYFFESHALKEAGFMMVELTRVYRQNDEKFISILNKIRDNKADLDTLAELNRRAHPSLMPADDADDGYIRLTTHNYRADRINFNRLLAIPSKGVDFSATVKGNFPRSSYPADETLTLKTGAQVMFIKNDLSGNHEYYNGLIGTVVSLSDSEVIVRPRPSVETGRQAPDIKVGMVSWDNVRYELNDSGELKEIIEGTFNQLPLRLAWAITIHKSQGLTFDKAIVDAARSFAPGQTYVALSRCRSLEGLVLDSPLPLSAIMTDPAVTGFINRHNTGLPSDSQIEDFRRSYYFDLLIELFSIREIDDAFDGYFRACAASLPRVFPRFMEMVDSARETTMRRLQDVSLKMLEFLRRGSSQLMMQGLSDERIDEIYGLIAEKVKSGSNYFFEGLNYIAKIETTTPLNLDNKALLKRLKTATQTLHDWVTLKLRLFRYFSQNPFDPDEYLKEKTIEIANSAINPKKGKNGKAVNIKGEGASGKKKKPASKSYEVAVPCDIENPDLYRRLAEWRRDKAEELNIKPYMIFSNKTLIDISNTLPENLYAMLNIYGISNAKNQKFGRDVIDIIENWKNKR